MWKKIVQQVLQDYCKGQTLIFKRSWFNLKEKKKKEKKEWKGKT